MQSLIAFFFFPSGVRAKWLIGTTKTEAKLTPPLLLLPLLVLLHIQVN